MPTKGSVLHLKKSRSGLYHIVLISNNHKVRLAGETYITKSNAHRAILKLSKDLNLYIA